MTNVNEISTPTSSHARWSSPWMRVALGVLVVVCTVIAFHGTGQLGWTNWDDGIYVYENPIVTQGDYAGCFKAPLNGGYTPLPQLMYTWEWAHAAGAPLSQAQAWLFHFDSLVLHLLSTLLVFWLMQIMGLRPVWAALGAILFGIHPMHVESVAWISERKDTLYGCFYLAALVSYLKYRDHRRAGWLVITMLCFVLALLSKLQAVTLPLSMWVLDGYRVGKWEWRQLWRLRPWLLLSLVVGLLGITVFAGGDGLPKGEITLPWWGRGILALHTLGHYLVKQFLPFPLAAVYPEPSQLNFWIILTACATLLGLLWLAWRRDRYRAAWAGMLFFVVNIGLLLTGFRHLQAYMADRYCYIASIGIFFACMVGLQQLADRGKLKAMLSIGLVAAFGLMLLWLTWQQVPTWRDSLTLWNHAIATSPKGAGLPYLNRGQHYRSIGDFEHAYADFDVLVNEWPGNPQGRLYRGIVALDLHRAADAMADFTHVISQYDPDEAVAFGPRLLCLAHHHRALAAVSMALYPEALTDYAVALRMNPNDGNTYKSRGALQVRLQDYAAALPDFDAAIRLDPSDGDAYHGRGFCQMNLQHYPAALRDLDQAIALTPQVPAIFLNRAYTHAFLGDRKAALRDAQKAASMGLAVDADFMAGLRP